MSVLVNFKKIRVQMTLTFLAIKRDLGTLAPFINFLTHHYSFY